MQLQNAVAVVTGASAGLGKAFALALVNKGCEVYGLARSEDKLDALRDTLGPRFHPVPCDVTDEKAVTDAFKEIGKDADRIDVLVNNAGLGVFGPVADLTVDEWDVQMATNLRGVFLCTRAVLPAMKAQNEKSGFGGHIVNIASIAGRIGNPNLAAYNTSKFGLRGFSDALMKEVRDDGIRVTCFYPGSIATGFGDKEEGFLSPHAMQPQDLAATLVHVLEAPDNYLISELVMRPLRPKG